VQARDADAALALFERIRSSGLVPTSSHGPTASSPPSFTSLFAAIAQGAANSVPASDAAAAAEGAEAGAAGSAAAQASAAEAAEGAAAVLQPFVSSAEAPAARELLQVGSPPS